MGSDTQEALSTGDTEAVKERSPFWNVTLPNRTGPKFDLKYSAKPENKAINQGMQCSYHKSGLDQEMEKQKSKQANGALA